MENEIKRLKEQVNDLRDTRERDIKALRDLRLEVSRLQKEVQVAKKVLESMAQII